MHVHSYLPLSWPFQPADNAFICIAGPDRMMMIDDFCYIRTFVVVISPGLGLAGPHLVCGKFSKFQRGSMGLHVWPSPAAVTGSFMTSIVNAQKKQRGYLSSRLQLSRSTLASAAAASWSIWIIISCKDCMSDWGELVAVLVCALVAVDSSFSCSCALAEPCASVKKASVKLRM